MLNLMSSQSHSMSLVNNTNELGQLEELTLPANESSITLHELKYSTRYKFYFSAKTLTGSGPSINEEFATIMDAGKLHLLLHGLYRSVACDSLNQNCIMNTLY